ncbi:E3 ubiquitin-protein ligase RNF125 isoform A [Alligator mississippiensis]|uniref:RING-type E3 ubiquitin transferase n=1 Tax=Alligator mississippiensis TaxID=8496 RepID=A0A151MNQ3_ALLMI|nr:E3 ubiquitin-protein ligase RNF125 isoform A [Alligator mississippiensis]
MVKVLLGRKVLLGIASRPIWLQPGYPTVAALQGQRIARLPALPAVPRRKSKDPGLLLPANPSQGQALKRTRFCHSCIAASLRNNAWTCPYCRTYLPSEGIPATDITKKMKSVFQNCTECETQVCLSEMRAHLRTCEQYIEKYGPLQELGDTGTRYACPFCQCELDEDDLMDHCLTYHRSERRAVYCPICRLIPGRDPGYFSRNFIRHLQLRHTFYYEDYIDINIVEEVLTERVLDRSLVEYVHANHPNSI